MNTRSIITSENILFDAINRINRENQETTITYTTHVAPLNKLFIHSEQRPYEVTQQVMVARKSDRHFFEEEPLGFGESRSVMSHEDVMNNLSDVGDFMYDGNVIYYNSPIHGLVQTVLHREGCSANGNVWIFRSY